MKKHKIFLYTFLYTFLLPLLAAQCDKSPPDSPDDGLPPITTEGKNTFGCRVNGEVWIPWIKFDLFDSAISTYNYKPTGGLNISAKKKVDNLDLFQNIFISSRNIQTSGRHAYRATRYDDYDTSFCSNLAFNIDTNTYNTLEILKLDTENHIISGTFEFTATNDECEDVIVTDGRFDLKY